MVKTFITMEVEMPAGRPKGSKSKTTKGYKARTRKIKQKYGADIFKEWGKKGGNPALLKPRRKKEIARKKEKAKKWPSWY